jgi:hypothetical protein
MRWPGALPNADIPDPVPGIAFIPEPIELLGCRSELDQQIAGQVLRGHLAPLLAPKTKGGIFVLPHDDASVRAPNEGFPVSHSFHTFLPQDEYVACQTVHLTLKTSYGSFCVKMYVKSLRSEQIRAARALLRWSAEELASHSRISLSTIRRAELAEGMTPMTEANELAVRRALELAGVEFIEENGGGAGVRLRKRQTKRP